jgi:hypothetical protein
MQLDVGIGNTLVLEPDRQSGRAVALGGTVSIDGASVEKHDR